MAWSTIASQVANTVASAANFANKVIANLNYLLSERPIGSVVHGDSADITTTSTSFVDVAPSTGGAAGITLTETIISGRADVMFSVTCTPPSTTSLVCFDIIRDGTTRAGGTNGLLMFDPGGGPKQAVVRYIFEGLSVGSHTFKLQWRSTAGNSATINNNPEPIVGIVMEI